MSITLLSACLQVRMGRSTEDFCCCVQLLSRVWLFVTPRTAAHQSPQSFPGGSDCQNFVVLFSAMFALDNGFELRKRSTMNQKHLLEPRERKDRFTLCFSWNKMLTLGWMCMIFWQSKSCFSSFKKDKTILISQLLKVYIRSSASWANPEIVSFLTVLRSSSCLLHRYI